MSEAAEKKLAALLEEFHSRRALGENPSVEEYREAAGEQFEKFSTIIETEAELDAALASPEKTLFPMPFGEYTLLSELGRGAVGVVYEAVHRGLGRKVALKILKTGFDTHPDAIARFKREARACAQVRHDNIVEIYEAGEHDDKHFYAMALLEGRSLKRMSQDGDLPDYRDFAARAADLIGAIHEMHQRGIVHRDIKPSNIMVEPAGRMVLADFGLARTVASESLTQTGDSLGTPRYMSPEQLIGDQTAINARTDVYGLGAAFYEVLADRHVFEASDISSLLRMILNERPDSLHDVAPQVPEPLANIVMKALEKRNDDRYETAAAMRDDLLAYASGEEVVGRPLTRWQHTQRSLKKNSGWMIAAVLVLGAAVTLWRMQPPAPATLVVATVPQANVSVNGQDYGEAPVEIELEPGPHVVELRRDGWEDRRRTIDLGEGQRQDLEMVLRPKDPSDPKALGELASAFDMTLSNWKSISSDRGSEDEAQLHVLFPRGLVQAEKLQEFRVRLGEAFDGAGSIVFKTPTQLLLRRAVGEDWPEDADARVRLPESVLKALRSGDEVTWGYEPKSGAPTLVKFRAASADVTKRAADLERKLRDQHPRVRAQLRAQLYLDAGLYHAAYVEAHDVAKQARAPAAYAVMKTALEKMGLKDSPLWTDLIQLSSR